MTTKPAPRPTPETAAYWDAAADGRFRLPRCISCDAWQFPPRPFCVECTQPTEWVDLSGRATLHSYVINARPVPGFGDDGGHVIALVQLEEGVRMLSNIVDVPADPRQLPLDMDLEVDFEAREGDVLVPVFRPAGSTP